MAQKTNSQVLTVIHRVIAITCSRVKHLDNKNRLMLIVIQGLGTDPHLLVDALDVVKVQLCTSCEGDDSQAGMVNRLQIVLCLIPEQVKPCMRFHSQKQSTDAAVQPFWSLLSMGVVCYT